jgi:ParB-like chromosome segregation protein Spo0J
MADQVILPLEVRGMDIEKIESLPDSLNPNIMSDEEEKALISDMKENGVDGIDPIEIVSKGTSYQERKSRFPSLDEKHEFVCVNGNHRLAAARKLKWTQIRIIVNQTVKNETDLLLLNYRKNAEHGKPDPFKEALLFKRLNDQGMTHEQIAKYLNLGDRTQVTKRLSLLKLSPAVLGITEKVEGITASHYEVLAPLPVEAQETVAREIAKQASWNNGSAPSERWITDAAHTAKKDLEARAKLKEILDKTEFKNCPSCKKPAIGLGWNSPSSLRCDNYHQWDWKTGKSEFGRSPSSLESSSSKKEEEPSFLRTEEPIEDYQELFSNIVKKVAAQIDIFSNAHLSSPKDTDLYVDLERRSDGFEFRCNLGRGEKYNLYVEEKKYTQPDMAKFKTVVRTDWGFAPKHTRPDVIKEKVDGLFEDFMNGKSEKDGLTKDDLDALNKLTARLKSGGNTGQLNALKKLREIAKV